MARFLPERAIFVRSIKMLVRDGFDYMYDTSSTTYDGPAMLARIRGHPRHVTMFSRRLYEHIRWCTGYGHVRALYDDEIFLKQFKIPVTTRTGPRHYHESGTRSVTIRSHHDGVLCDMVRCPSRTYS